MGTETDEGTVHSRTRRVIQLRSPLATLAGFQRVTVTGLSDSYVVTASVGCTKK